MGWLMRIKSLKFDRLKYQISKMLIVLCLIKNSKYDTIVYVILDNLTLSWYIVLELFYSITSKKRKDYSETEQSKILKYY